MVKTIAVPLGQKPRNRRLVFSPNITQATYPIQNAHVLCRSLWYFQDLPLSETPPRGWKMVYVNRIRFGTESHLITESGRIDRLLRRPISSYGPKWCSLSLILSSISRLLAPSRATPSTMGNKNVPGPISWRGRALRERLRGQPLGSHCTGRAPTIRLSLNRQTGS